MRFGLFYEHQLPRPWADGDEEQLLLDALEQVELADRLGIDVVWEVEHHFLEEYSHSSAPEVFLAAASQRTSRIRLGHGIVQIPPSVNHPARVAERVATLDLLSGGRVEFGTGEGSSQVELGGFAVEREAKRDQWTEALDVVVRMLTETPFSGHRGRWIDVPPRNVVPKPKQLPHPPLWVACSRRETIELAARKGLGALSFSFIEPEEAKPWVESYYQIIESDQCMPAGLAVNPNVAVVLPFMCHAEEETAIERGIDGAHFFAYSLAHYYVFGEHVPGRTSVWEEFDRYRNQRGFARAIIRAEAEPLGMKVVQAGIGALRGAIGTPDQVADLIARYHDAGVDQVILVAQAGRNRHEHICEALELFADQVLPRFAGGREEREAAKADRLAHAVTAAMGRRRSDPPRDTTAYVVSPAGELVPAGAPQAPRLGAAGRSEAARRRWRDAGQAALAALVRRASEQQLTRIGGSAPALRTVLGALARTIEAEGTVDLDATVQFLLDADGDTHAWTLRIRDGRAAARRAQVAAPDVTLRTTVADFLRIASGELPTGKAVFDERMSITGDVRVASRLLTATGGDPY
jgi:alkanesulfonate monooxygenase SsuD/methylene tetrahydromethanopterin reductase-like flavin-dependent oxidoreductase (luciferase family)